MPQKTTKNHAKNGKKLRFSEKASAKARGLIARTGGKNKGHIGGLIRK